MIQEIVVYLVILCALGFAAYNVYQFFNPKRKAKGNCAGCNSGCCAVSGLNKPK
ncbi:MAG TPA: hypothetical protein DDY04_05525 [Bacteroidales bacterium]|nr:hypothetical protein [Bacteroidales bacterium]